ncbi:MAG: helix-turn-helix transcriptional regulator [Candidatus Aminicenantes bacterium]|nr:helix-turn-helix transcriptional regulator [Candidatus Aminicenantes bacterium]
MQDKIILGLLLDKGEMTSYKIRKIMENSTSLFYTTSLGSINPAFKKLEKEDAVSSRTEVENNRVKKYYSVTEKGKKLFTEWMRADIEISKLKENALLKMFFFAHVTPEKRKEIIENYLEKIKIHLGVLDEIGGIYCTEENCEGDVLRFGIDYYNFTHNWFEKYLKDLEENKK